MKIQESGEMYLEAILVLRKDNPQVRAIDIANYTGYSKPSVSRAMHILKDAGLIDMDESGHITLTESGNELAERVLDILSFKLNSAVKLLAAVAEAPPALDLLCPLPTQSAKTKQKAATVIAVKMPLNKLPFFILSIFMHLLEC